MNPRTDEATLPHGTALSPLQAAFVAEVSRKTIDQAIDRGEVHALSGLLPGEAARRVGYAELIYFRLRGEMGDLLSTAGKRRLYLELRRVVPANPKPHRVEVDMLSIAIDDAVTRVRHRLARLRGAERYVTARPDVRAGEPVVRGTRVPVHVLADLTTQGASREELLEDYPAVTPPALDAALLYAELHPRRGPRRAAPWHPQPSGEA